MPNAVPNDQPQSREIDSVLHSQEAARTAFRLRLPPQQYFPSVQGLRGVSALSVFVVHIYLMALHGGFFPVSLAPLQSPLSTLGNGVALFFIISGFVIPASLFRHHDVRRFLLDRVLRIMPVFLVLHILVFAVGPFIGYKWLRGVGELRYLTFFVSNMTFTALPLGLPLAQQNAWTLTYEWAFYLFVATAWTMIVSPRRRQFTYAIIASAALVACAVFPICCYFVIGMMFSFLRTKINIGRVQECVLVPICVMAFFYGAEFVSYFAAIPPALLIFWVVLQDGSLTSRLLRIPALQYCGKISYSLYLIHPIAMFPYQSLGAYLVRRNFNSSILFGAFVVLGVSTTMAASIVSYAWLEVRLRNQVVLWISARTQAKKAVLF